MALPQSESLKIKLSDALAVSALLQVPPSARAAFVFAHGAGAGMTHSFMTTVADGLVARGIATLRYQFPYMEQGSKRPDRPAVAQAAVRAAVLEMANRFPNLPLFAGGKSFGARMTSQAQAVVPLEGVRGLIFFGFPLHPAGQPSTDRAKHLSEVHVPMLFLQGTRDALAEWALIDPLCRKLGRPATLHRVEHADHAFHVLVRSGRTDAEVVGELLDASSRWIDHLL